MDSFLIHREDPLPGGVMKHPLNGPPSWAICGIHRPQVLETMSFGSGEGRQTGGRRRATVSVARGIRPTAVRVWAKFCYGTRRAPTPPAKRRQSPGSPGPPHSERINQVLWPLVSSLEKAEGAAPAPC